MNRDIPLNLTHSPQRQFLGDPLGNFNLGRGIPLNPYIGSPSSRTSVRPNVAAAPPQYEEQDPALQAEELRFDKEEVKAPSAQLPKVILTVESTKQLSGNITTPTKNITVRSKPPQLADSICEDPQKTVADKQERPEKETKSLTSDSSITFPNLSDDLDVPKRVTIPQDCNNSNIKENFSTTCSRCKEQFASGNALSKHLKDSRHDKEDENNSATLHAVVSNGHHEIVKLLLDQGGWIEAKDDNGRTLLYSAASSGHLETVKVLIDRGAKIEAKEVDGWTPLHSAASNGHVEVAKLLLDRGANIEAKEVDGWTPLHFVASDGYIEVAKLLLDRGAEIETKDIYRWTPLYSAEKNGHLEVVKLLKKYQG